MKNLKAAVAMLRGMSPDEIAAYMLETGNLGRPRTVRSCPLSSFLSMQCGAARSVIVGKTKIIRVKHTQHAEKVEDELFTPKNFMEFVARFDDLQYPELVRPVNDRRPRKKKGPARPKKSPRRHQQRVGRF